MPAATKCLRPISAHFLVLALAALSTGTAYASQFEPQENAVPKARFVTPDGRIGHPVRILSNAGLADSKTSIPLSSWSGQISSVSGGTVQTVFGYFTVPLVTCNSTSNLFTPWIGLDGWDAGTMQEQSTAQQAGIAISCNTGQPTYQAWWGMYPAAPVYISSSGYPVFPGDVIAILVTNNSSAAATSGDYIIQIDDLGPNGLTKAGNPQAIWAYQTEQNGGPLKSSAGEAVLESPTQSYPNFGTVTFSNLGGLTHPANCSNLFYQANPPTSPACALGMAAPKINTVDAGYPGHTQVSTSPLSYGASLLPTLLPYNATYTATFVSPLIRLHLPSAWKDHEHPRCFRRNAQRHPGKPLRLVTVVT